MPSGGPFPSTHHAFNTYILNAVSYLNTNAVRFVISTANLQAMNDKKTAWDTLWAKYIDPALVTSQIREQVNSMIADWKLLLSSIYNDIPTSALTNTDRSTLNIGQSTTHIAATVADHSPSLHIDEISHLQAKLRITDPAFPNTNSMPSGQHVHLHVGIQDTPTSPIVWDILRLMEIHKFLANVIFTDADVSKKAHFRTCYVNTHGEKGPLSDIISTTIA